MKKRTAFIAFGVALWLGISSCSALAPAAKYPSKPIDLIVATAPGGGADVSARLIASYASKKFGQSVNVVNVAGASGVTGVLQALQAAPDGYTMMLEGAFVSSYMYAMRTDLPMKLEDRTFIAQATADYMVFIVNKDTGWKTLSDALNALKAKPADFGWGAGVFGGSPMFAHFNLFMGAGVPFEVIKQSKMMVFDKGNVQSLQAVTSGDIQMAVSSPADIKPVIATGKVLPVAVTSPVRMKDFPDVPTTKELGYPNANFSLWYGISGPPKLPADVVKAWDDLLKGGASDNELLAEADKLGGKQWVYVPADQFKKAILDESVTATKIATDLGLRR